MQQAILASSKLVAFVPATDPAKARLFYQDVLGLRLIADERPFALVFDVNGTMLRVTFVREYTPDPFTVLGWQVAEIESTVERLTAAVFLSSVIQDSMTTRRKASGLLPAARALPGFTIPTAMC